MLGPASSISSLDATSKSASMLAGSETHCHVLGNEAGTTRQHGSPPSSKEGGSMRGSAIVRPVKPHVAGENQSGPVSGCHAIQSRESGDEHSVMAAVRRSRLLRPWLGSPPKVSEGTGFKTICSRSPTARVPAISKDDSDSVSDEAERGCSEISTKILRWGPVP